MEQTSSNGCILKRIQYRGKGNENGNVCGAGKGAILNTDSSPTSLPEVPFSGDPGAAF